MELFFGREKDPFSIHPIGKGQTRFLCRAVVVGQRSTIRGRMAGFAASQVNRQGSLTFNAQRV